MGFPGAIVATVAVFLRSFLILVGAFPFFDRLRHLERFSHAIAGILCPFVGLLGITALRFALNVHWNAFSVFLAALAFDALRLKVDILWVVLRAAAPDDENAAAVSG
jgi:chromate transporter